MLRLICSICVYEIDKDRYAIISPDFDVVSEGKTLTEATDKITAEISKKAYLLYVQNKSLPKTLANDIDLDKEFSKIYGTLYYEEGSVSMLVTEISIAEMERSVKKNLSIPKWLDELAREKDINFSQTLQEALKKILLGNDDLGQ